MVQIELLQIGCTIRQVIDAINALIAAHNSGEGGGVVSYNDLLDLPVINGVELKGTKTTADLLIAMAGCTDYNMLIPTLATKAYSDEHDAIMVDAARAAAQAVLDNKLDKDLGNIEATSIVGDDAYLLVVSGGRVVKITTASLATYTNVTYRRETSSYEAVIRNQRKRIQLEGEQNGRNQVFTATAAFETGTSALYFNGNRQELGEDYVELNTTEIECVTFTPGADDKLFFEAVPLG